MGNRRNRRFNEKKPVSTESLVYAGIGAGCILANGLIIALAAGVEGTLANIFGGLSLLFMLISILVLVRGGKVLKNENFNKASRVVGVVVPGIATALWVLLYIIGIIMG